MMKFINNHLDKFAIGFSTLCVVHCLATPLLFVLFPTLASLPMDPEQFHIWMVIAVIPTSLYALTLGCKKHKKFSVASYGLIGLVFLIAAMFVDHLGLGEAGEKVFTVIGAIIIALAHFKNYKLCQNSDDCTCPSENN